MYMKITLQTVFFYIYLEELKKNDDEQNGSGNKLARTKLIMFSTPRGLVLCLRRTHIDIKYFLGVR